MDRAAVPHECIRFGIFEVDLHARELRRDGTILRLQEQPFRALELLLKSSGRLVTRDELRTQLWPADVFVDFDRGISSAVGRLREALGDSAENPRYVRTVGRRGYRWIAPVSTNPRGADALLRPDLLNQTGTHAPVRPSSQRRRVWVMVAVAVALVLTVAGIAFHRRIGSGQAPVRSLAVLPLTNLTGKAENDYLTDGMTDELITDLAKLGAIRVISHTSVQRFKGTQKSLPEIAHELDVDAIVEGTVESSPGRIHVTAQLLQANPEKHLWAESYDRSAEDAVAVQSELAREMAGAVGISLSPEQQARLKRGVSPEAFQLYLHGRYFWNKRTEDGFRQAIAYFQQAINKAPDDAASYAGLADSYLLLGGYGFVPQGDSIPKARAAALRALELNSSLADAHATLGLIAENYDWNWAEAERQYRQAIALNPNYATAHHWYGEYLGLKGRFDEGLAEIQVAESLDPLSPSISTDHGAILLCARQYDKAIAQFHKTLEIDSAYYPAHGWLVQAEVFKGMVIPQDLAALENLQVPAGLLERDAVVAFAYARTGRRAEAANKLQHLEDLAGVGHVVKGKMINVDKGMLVIVYLGLGDKERALALMEQEYAAHSPGLNEMKVHPIFDPLRSDPRFIDLMRRVGLSN